MYVCMQLIGVIRDIGVEDVQEARDTHLYICRDVCMYVYIAYIWDVWDV
jgi:hypothetical protein